ncbi:magnesium and cobalt efflux protein CorC [Aquipluma nitroreducens]|uniref:Magnesium and cobalt efflux protein CorC n=1 Tax=Aquipluma nitroreducens TaxID=2010828 RepID=A0A5K7SBE8_9BACT|nr:hemolysin family protein [Aquipluma nitroreducens]BBE18903.1 magnesium and cobalt efflux protein CorC [Aquipluma nitroreducens]
MNLLIVIFITILFSAFFSGMEIAFISANKLRLELDKKQNVVFSSLISLYTQNPGQFIATMLVGNNLALVIYGIAFANLLKPILFLYLQSDSLVLLAQTIISTLIILATAEYLPKMLFRINPNKILKAFTVPIAFFYFLFYPITKIAMGISKFVLKVILNEKIQNVDEKVVFSRIDLTHFVDEQENNIAPKSGQEIDNEVKLFRNALDFSKVKLREVMVPRTEMVALDIDSTVEELHQKFIETGYSRILFYSGNIDNIVGYIHHSVIFTKPDSIKSNLRKVLIVPETMPASKLLSKFIQQRLSMAIVVDEFGGTSGMVTSEDILEEIFGEIEDEHDTIDLIMKKINDAEFVLSGRLELDELNENFDLEFPENENFETLAGFILANYESIPKVNTVITIDQYQFRILKATSTKIELVHLKILDDN